jgi:hypothetical protein
VPTTAERRPYLSVVATARNDNHGGNLLHRMQVFVSGLAAQCERFHIPAELILVEWNPPPDRERLVDALEWPRDSLLDVRIIEVPHELHARLDHAARLPLFQMIAKNTGIRRARGSFVLATNVDVLLSDELMRVVADRRLRSGHLYRADRHDVDVAIDPSSPIEEQLASCSSSVIRICAIHGTTDVRTGEYFAVYGPMSHWPGPLGRWGRLIRFGVPFVSRRSLALARHATVKLWHAFRRIAAVGLRILRRVAVGVEHRLALVILVLQVLLQHASSRGIARLPGRLARTLGTASGRSYLRELVAPALAAHEAARPRRLHRRPLRADLGLLGAVIRAELAGFASAVGAIGAELHARRLLIAQLWEQEKARVFLHTNACGDFTLMSREDWFRMRGYAELQIFSMHLDSLLLYEAHYSGIEHVVLRGPVYHLEHSGGFKPDTAGLKQLNDRLDREAIPQVTNEQFLEWVIQMFRLRRPIAFNHSSWGLVDSELREVEVTATREREPQGVV